MEGPPAAFVLGTRRLWTGITTGAANWAFYLAAGLTGTLHLLEVHLVDASAAAWARGLTGRSFTHWTHLEAGLFRALDVWMPEGVVAAFTVYYLVGFVVLLLVVPPLVAMTGDGVLLARALLAYPLAWLVALPFNLFVPSKNPYMALGLGDPFVLVHPDLSRLYYTVTTVDNTFPSLHVTFTAVLVLVMMRSHHDLLKGAFVVHGVLIGMSVIVVKVHYVADVVAGLLAAAGVLWMVERLVRPNGARGVARLLAASSRVGRDRRERHFCRVEGSFPWLRGSAGDLEQAPAWPPKRI